MKKSKKTAVAGVLTALCVIFLFIGSLFQTLDLSAAGLGSIIVLIAMIELGKSWAFGVYVSASVLSLILLPNKSAALIFALLVGFYPIFPVIRQFCLRSNTKNSAVLYTGCRIVQLS